MENENFIFYKSWWEILADERRDVQWEVIHAIMEYVFCGNLVELKPNSAMAFKFIKRDLDRAKERQQEKAEKLKNAGKKGGNPNFKKGQPNPYYQEDKDNPNITQDNPTLANITQDNPNININTKKYNINKLLFFQIENLTEVLKVYQGEKRYLFLAYKFWKLWHDDNPDNLTVKKAKVSEWVDTIRKLIEIDKVPETRLVAIYTYFQEIANDRKGIKKFWFETIKSVGGLRKHNANGEFNIDRIADEINNFAEKDDEFYRLIEEKIKNYESTYPPKKTT